MTKAERQDLRRAILSAIEDEVDRAERLHPKWPVDPIHAAAIVAEESGELQRAAVQSVYEPAKGKRGDIETEAIHTAATCVRLLANMSRYKYHLSQYEPTNNGKDRTP